MVVTKLNALKYFWSWILGFILFQEKSVFVSCFLVLIGALLISLTQPESLCIATYAITMIIVALSKMVRMPHRFAIVANFLGDLSFPLYLFHFPVFVFIYIFLESRLESLFIGLSLLITVLVFYLIDVYLKNVFFAPIVRSLLNRIKS
jgi:peptidoglycan/LPS O-acetylase OafA/YrhL